MIIFKLKKKKKDVNILLKNDYFKIKKKKKNINIYSNNNFENTFMLHIV